MPNTDEQEELEVEEELEEEDEVDEDLSTAPAWGGGHEEETQSVFVDTGRGHVEEVAVGANFAETIERLAEAAHYGGYFRVFLNSSEIVDPEQSPEMIESGMRIAITAYDKVGA